MKKAIMLPIPVDNPAKPVSNSANDRLISTVFSNPACVINFSGGCYEPKLHLLMLPFKYKFALILSIGDSVFPRAISVKSKVREGSREKFAVHFTE